MLPLLAVPALGGIRTVDMVLPPFSSMDLTQAVQSRTLAICSEYTDRHASDKSRWWTMFQTYRTVCLHIVSSTRAFNEKMWVDGAILCVCVNCEWMWVCTYVRKLVIQICTYMYAYACI